MNMQAPLCLDNAGRSLDGKAFLVAGSTSGIDLGIAGALAAAGSAVELNSFGKGRAPQAAVQQSWASRLIGALRRWRSASKTRRLEWAAIDHLSSLSDHALKDIGLGRSEIVRAVRNREGRGRGRDY